MPFVADDLATLDRAIASGARVVQFQDRKVEYQDTRAMLEARTAILQELSASGSSPAPIRQIRIRTERGF